SDRARPDAARGRRADDAEPRRHDALAARLRSAWRAHREDSPADSEIRGVEREDRLRPRAAGARSAAPGRERGRYRLTAADLGADHHEFHGGRAYTGPR